jgi:hypothetical protein
VPQLKTARSNLIPVFKTNKNPRTIAGIFILHKLLDNNYIWSMLYCINKGFNMKTFKQDYSLKKNKEAGAGFSDFATAYYGFDMPPVSECLKISQEFVEMVYQNAKADTITFVHGPNDVHSIYLGKVLLAKIRGEKLVQLWMPGLEKQDKTTNFLKGMGTQYLTFAGFPDLVHGGNKFLREARDLKCLYVPKMQDAGIETLYCSQLERVDLPALT